MGSVPGTSAGPRVSGAEGVDGADGGSGLISGGGRGSEADDVEGAACSGSASEAASEELVAGSLLDSWPCAEVT